MSATPRPHDLVWLNLAPAPWKILPSRGWLQQWRAALPVVVRRDVDDQARVPVGVRGMKREQRRRLGTGAQYRAQRHPGDACRARSITLLAVCLAAAGPGGYRPSPYTAGPWGWGVTGSTGYALATEIPVLHAGQRSGSADPRATAAGPRGAAGMANPGGPTPMPR